jgi:hypothetical protein
MPEYRRTWGFRLSVTDVVFVLLAIPATWLASPHIGLLAGVIPMAVGHFFLFCNVFRIIRWKELLWTAVFLVNVIAWTLADDCWWPGILALRIPLTVVLIVSEMRQPYYHGIWAKGLNPHLDDYLTGKT